MLRVVGDDLGYRFRFYNDRSVFDRAEPAYLISYGERGDHNLPAHPLLSGKDYDFSREAEDFVTDDRGRVTICQTPDGPDLLAAVFFCLSRYEEYHDFTADNHDRFPASASHARRFGYLGRPVVREWTAALGTQLTTWFPGLPSPKVRPLRFEPTYDIDLLWAYQHRGWRGYASGLRDLARGKIKRCVARFTTAADDDPYQTLPFLESLHHKYQLQPTYFWLVSDRSLSEDANPYPIPERQTEWIIALSQTAMVGIHPSYASNERPSLIEEEKDRLEAIIGSPVTHSRQHFLKVRFPETYQQLLRHGIRADHTMGYGDGIGWRAGTNLPFPWYDLEHEKETRLTVHPFAAMDVTLRKYLDLSAAEAEAEILSLAGAVSPYGGPFVLLWHNSSFAPAFGWTGWREMYERLVHALASE